MIQTMIGVLIAISGVLATHFWLNPVLEQRKLFGEIARALMDYANALGSREINDRSNEAQKVLRNLSCRLLAQSNEILFYGLLATLKLVPSPSILEEASAEIMGLSNAAYRTDDETRFRLPREDLEGFEITWTQN